MPVVNKDSGVLLSVQSSAPMARCMRTFSILCTHLGLQCRRAYSPAYRCSNLPHYRVSLQHENLELQRRNASVALTELIEHHHPIAAFAGSPWPSQLCSRVTLCHKAMHGVPTSPAVTYFTSSVPLRLVTTQHLYTSKDDSTSTTHHLRPH